MKNIFVKLIPTLLPIQTTFTFQRKMDGLYFVFKSCNEYTIVKQLFLTNRTKKKLINIIIQNNIT